LAGESTWRYRKCTSSRYAIKVGNFHSITSLLVHQLMKNQWRRLNDAMALFQWHGEGFSSTVPLRQTTRTAATTHFTRTESESMLSLGHLEYWFKLAEEMHTMGILSYS
jgi:hypothetical protein